MAALVLVARLHSMPTVDQPGPIRLLRVLVWGLGRRRRSTSRTRHRHILERERERVRNYLHYDCVGVGGVSVIATVVIIENYEL